MTADQMTVVRVGRLTVGGRRVRVLVGGILAFGLVASVTVPPEALPLPVCGFKEATGVSCLTCGLTRSLHAAARGDVLEAFHFHLLGPLVLAGCILAAALFLVEGLRGKSLLPNSTWRAWRPWALGVATLWILFGIVRATFELLVTISS